MVDQRQQHIPAEIIERIKERADIVQLLSPYVTLRKAGKNYMAPCPFHQETKPSFTVNPVMQYYYCFGCGAKGNIFSFFMQYNNLSFPEAVRFVAERVGVVIPEQSVKEKQVERKEKEERDRLIEINELAAAFFVRILKDQRRGKAARDYLTERGLKSETIELFQLGLAPPPWDELYKYLLKKGCNRTDLMNTGLFIQKEKTTTAYDRFRDRIIFPLKNARNEIAGFAGRVMSGDEAKYINSPETPLYQKRKMLYGLSWNGEAIRRDRSALIVEGYFDLISLHQAGVQNVVATCGTALTDEHINLLRRYSRTIKLVFDSDQAGINAALRSLDMLIERDLDLNVCLLTGSKDPDEFVRENGRDAFLQVLENGQKPFPFILEYSARDRDLKETDDVMAYLDAINPFIMKINDPVKRSLVLKQVSEYVHVDQRDLYQRFRQRMRSGGKEKAKQSVQPKQVNDFELDLLTLLLHNPLKIERYRPEIQELIFQAPQLTEFAKLMISVWEKEQITQPQQWLDCWGVMPMKDVLIRLCMSPTIETNVDDQIQGWLAKARIKVLERMRQERIKILDQPQLQKDLTKFRKISQEIMALTSQIQELTLLLK
ncbi:DNA primase [bacterium]|nr:DNA primase [bacterium]